METQKGIEITDLSLAEKIIYSDPAFYGQNEDVFKSEKFLRDYLLLEKFKTSTYFAVNNEGLLKEEYKENTETKIVN